MSEENEETIEVEVTDVTEESRKTSRKAKILMGVGGVIVLILILTIIIGGIWAVSSSRSADGRIAEAAQAQRTAEAKTVEAEKLAAEQADAKSKLAEAERVAAEQTEKAEKLAAKQEADRVEAERIAVEQEEQRVEAERVAAEQAELVEAERLAELERVKQEAAATARAETEALFAQKLAELEAKKAAPVVGNPQQGQATAPAMDTPQQGQAAGGNQTFDGRPIVSATFLNGESAIRAAQVIDIPNKAEIVLAHNNAKEYQRQIGAPHTDGFFNIGNHPEFGEIRYFLVFYPNDPPPAGKQYQMPRFFAPKNAQDRAAFERDFALPEGFTRWEQDSGASRAMMAVR